MRFMATVNPTFDSCKLAEKYMFLSLAGVYEDDEKFSCVRGLTNELSVSPRYINYGEHRNIYVGVYINTDLTSTYYSKDLIDSCRSSYLSKRLNGDLL